MKRTICYVFLAVCAAVFMRGAAGANELDDRNVANLFIVADRVCSYGDLCWEVRFKDECKLHATVLWWCACRRISLSAVHCTASG
ncbi:MAG: hypothetical protein LBI74_07945 [Synergistaceae bacterium]|nr:hypothetical protein [Synergistaceae bacterium]